MDLFSNTTESEGQEVLKINNILVKSKLETTLYVLLRDDSQLYFSPRLSDCNRDSNSETF